MKRFKILLSNKDGGFGILFVLIIFVACLVIMGFQDVLVRSYTMGEVQSNMDVSGVSALQSAVDETKLRVEIFDVDQHIAKSNYQRMISKRLSNADKIESYRFHRTQIETFNSNFGLGKSSKHRPQALLDSTIILIVDSSQMFDLIPGTYETYYDSFDGQYFDVNYLGKNEDGKVELSVRSVSRLVYR